MLLRVELRRLLRLSRLLRLLYIAFVGRVALKLPRVTKTSRSNLSGE